VAHALRIVYSSTNGNYIYGILYNKMEQKTAIGYGNGTTAIYGYDTVLTSTAKNHKALLLNDLPKQRATTLFNFRVIDKALNFGVFSLLDILFVTTVR
jgi:hypothetical protein